VQAWHVDHGWRASSAHEAALLATWAEQWGVPFMTQRLPVASGSNREAEARQGRYTCFEQWSLDTGISTICLGHHRDDQAETVCMRLLQGAGAGGCRGMSQQRSRGRLQLLRPLLHVPALTLKTALRQAGIDWLEDPSNHDTTIWRNRIRHRLFPAMQQAGQPPVELFLRWQQQAVRLAARLDKEAELLSAQVEHSGTHAEVSLPWRTWTGCSAAVRARLLQQMVASILGEGATPGRRHILMVEDWTLRSGRGGLDLSRCRLQRRRSYLHLMRTTAGLSA